MRLAIVGPGALGTVLAVRLARSGPEIVVAGRPGAVAPEGVGRFRVEGTDPAQAEVAWWEEDAPAPHVAGAALTVKSYDLAAAASRLAHVPPAPILLVQNGLGIEEIAARPLRHAGRSGPVPGLVRAVVSIPSTLLGPGLARQAGRGEVLLANAPPPEAAEAAERWAAWLLGAGIPVRRVDDFPREVWRKLLVNASINPVTADHGVENGQVAHDPWRGQALVLLHEARSVALAEGFEFSESEAEGDLFAVVRSTALNRSSMLQDLDHRRPTEIDAISGELLLRGARHGLDLPATRRAFDRIRRRAAGPDDGPAPQKG